MVCFGEFDLLLGDLGLSFGLDGDLDVGLNEMTEDSGVLGSVSPGFVAGVLGEVATGVLALGLLALGVEGLFTLGVTDFGLCALGVDFFGLMGLDVTILGLLEAGVGLFTDA